MITPIIVYKLIAVLCVFGAVSTFFFWIGQRIISANLQGRELLDQLRLSPKVEVEKAPLIAQASNVGVPFLPLIKRWEETNRFGVADLLNKAEQQLIKAGVRPTLAPIQFMSASLVFAICSGLVGALLASELYFGLFGALIFGFPAGVIAGFYFPSVMITNIASNRIALMEKRLPFATEFMLLAMEANASFPAAMEVYCKQMLDDPLAEEFRIALLDIESGQSEKDALLTLQTRVGSESVSAFILAVVTGIETGQPLKDVLEVQADVTRQRRYQSAEEIAKTAATRAVFPLFIVVIALLILLFGPMLIMMMQGSLL